MRLVSSSMLMLLADCCAAFHTCKDYAAALEAKSLVCWLTACSLLRQNSMSYLAVLLLGGGQSRCKQLCACEGFVLMY